MSKVGLVLEGGGFRGLFTEGILEHMIDAGIELPYVVGVSMGSINGASYIAKHKRRNYDVVMTYVDDDRYLSFKNMVTKQSMFGLDFMFGDLAYELIPFDFETFDRSSQELVIGAMSCHSGITDYFYKSKLSISELFEALKASCSLPFITKPRVIKGIEYLDGGVSDSIPYEKAFEDGCDRVVVVLTRHESYIREAFTAGRFSQFLYKDHPAVLKMMESRHERYAKQLEALNKLEAEGKAFVIRPPRPIELGRMEKNREKLRRTYIMGYEEGEVILPKLQEWLEKA